MTSQRSAAGRTIGAPAVPIFRASVRSRVAPVASGAGADAAVARGLVGIGERVEPAPPTVAAAILALTMEHGEKAGRMLHHFAELADGVFVWTRQSNGLYRLGRIAGPWTYDDSPEMGVVGIHHVRPAAWSEHPFTDASVPGAVFQTFARGGRNFQRIHDHRAEVQTQRYWDRYGPR
jgi:hypothetical protein